jgi:hypothetical protein
MSESEWEAVERRLAPILRRQYHDALDALLAVLKDPQRERQTVWEGTSRLQASGIPEPEHISDLVGVARQAREGGIAYAHAEQAIFEALTRLNHPDLLPFLAEAYDYTRAHDLFAGRRRAYAVDMVATMAIRLKLPEAYAWLGKILAQPDAKRRGTALVIIYEAFDRDYGDFTPEMQTVFQRASQADPDRRVRQTALACLLRMAQANHPETEE